jgi:hypothetical protein
VVLQWDDFTVAPGGPPDVELTQGAGVGYPGVGIEGAVAFAPVTVALPADSPSAPATPPPRPSPSHEQPVHPRDPSRGGAIPRFDFNPPEERVPGFEIVGLATLHERGGAGAGGWTRCTGPPRERGRLLICRYVALPDGRQASRT